MCCYALKYVKIISVQKTKHNTVSYADVDGILLSNIRTDPSPTPATMMGRLTESLAILVTQLSAPVGIS